MYTSYYDSLVRTSRTNTFRITDCIPVQMNPCCMKYVPHNFQRAFLYLSMPSADIHSFGIFVLIVNCEEEASSKAYFTIYVHVFPS